MMTQDQAKPETEQYPKLRYSETPSTYVTPGLNVFMISADSEENWTAVSLTADRARRLAACWNACEGISTELLEASEPGNELFTAMRQQRDEAHTALLALLAASQMHGTCSEEYSDALFAAADLLAKTGVNVVSVRP